jgi:hypothetical protein
LQQQQLLPNSMASYAAATAAGNGVMQGEVLQGDTGLAESPAGRQSVSDPAVVTLQLSDAEVLMLRSWMQEREARGGSGEQLQSN